MAMIMKIKKMKYEFTKETKKVDGKLLYRIRAFRDFGDIDKGQLGGWAEGNWNLSHDGDCWIHDDAMSYDEGSVSGNAQIYDNAKVFYKAKISGNVEMSDTAIACGNANISGDVVLSNNVRIGGDVILSGNIMIDKRSKKHFRKENYLETRENYGRRRLQR
ncbi:MAG: hypothetical protein JJV93_01325 [Alphaproteobacteria bacterium]|nr:hypothetical protein [Alphaproteobacteria bacterium]